MTIQGNAGFGWTAAGVRLKLPLLIVMVVTLAAAAPSTPEAPYLFGIPGLTIGSGGIWTGVAMVAAWMAKEYRETRKLSAEDRLARREGYAKQVENLQRENRSLRSDLRDAETLHNDYRRSCQAETDQLRGEVRTLEDKIVGFERTLAAQAGAYGRAVVEGVNAPTAQQRMGETK